MASIFEFFKKHFSVKKNKSFADILNGYTPIFSQFGNNIYASDVVQQAINCIVREMKKLEPKHVLRDENGDFIPQRDRIQSVLNRPNPLMTTTDFIEKIVWNLMFNYNSFIIPIWTDTGELDSLYPVQPIQVDFLQDKTERIFIKMRFANEYEGTMPYSDVIHIRYNFSVSEYMGGDENGRPNYNSLLKTLELNNVMLEGVGKALKSSFAINGIIKYNTIIDSNKMGDEIKRLEEHLKNNESGLLGLDLKGEFIPFTRNIKLVDADTLKFIDEKILRNFGVPISILTGDYTIDQYNAFYQKTLEPLAISMSQAFTKTLFTNREADGFGHRIMFFTKELIFLSTAQKLEVIRLLGDSGALFENEKRTMMGLQPLPDLVGKRVASLNYIDADKATEYQLKQKEDKSTLDNSTKKDDTENDTEENKDGEKAQ